MRVAAAMSGSGTNIRKLWELEQLLKNEGKYPFEIVAIITDVLDPEECNAKEMSRQFGVDYFASDIEAFYAARGLVRKKVPYGEKLGLLQEFYAPIDKFLKENGISCVAYGGYMNLVSEPVLSGYININVHPADLRVLDESGRRKYTGDNAVRKAILAGEKYLYSSTHLINAELDGGPVVLVSPPLEVDLMGMTLDYVRADRDFAGRVARHNQNRLKEAGDWVVFPQTVQLVSEGKVYIDGSEVHFI